MEQEPRIEVFPEKRFVGKRISMCISQNKTRELWQGFMPRRTEIKDVIGSEFYSIEVYPPGYFDHFDPEMVFDKWASVQVATAEAIPDGMVALLVPEGLYAVFIHKGPASLGPETFLYIFGSWIPESQYEVDDRPHFEIMDHRYKGEAIDSEEELRIPIRKK
ncbi:MAG: GyrI-like domain-containing protein [Saprospiraceae bacterium]